MAASALSTSCNFDLTWLNPDHHSCFCLFFALNSACKILFFDPNCQKIQIWKQLQTWISSTVLLSFFCSALTWFRHSHSKVGKKKRQLVMERLDNKRTWFTQTYPHAIKFAICVCFQRVGCIKCCIFTWNNKVEASIYAWFISRTHQWDAHIFLCSLSLVVPARRKKC